MAKFGALFLKRILLNTRKEEGSVTTIYKLTCFGKEATILDCNSKPPCILFSDSLW